VKIVPALDHLYKSWGHEGSLTGVRIAAVGNRVAVRDEASRRCDAETGQLLLDFDGKPAASNIASLQAPLANRAREVATNLLYRAWSLEDEDIDAPQAACREVFAGVPDYTDASLNLRYPHVSMVLEIRTNLAASG
jgi:hypothetical protein